MGQELCSLCESKEQERSNDNQSSDAKMSPAKQEDAPKRGVVAEPDDSQPNTNIKSINKRTVTADGKPDGVNIPTEVREKIGLANCMISNVTLSKMTDTRYIQKDYFIAKDQKRNHTVRNLDTKEWDALYEEVMQAIEADLVKTMVQKAQ